MTRAVARSWLPACLDRPRSSAIRVRGPPLLCLPFDVGAARPLPLGRNGWRDVHPTYDVSDLVDDTLGLFGPAAPLNLRMETLCRRRGVRVGAAEPCAGAGEALEGRANAKTPLVVFRSWLSRRSAA